MAQTEVQLNLFDLAMQQKQLVGCIFGNANPRRDIPRLLRLYMDGQAQARRAGHQHLRRSRTINQGYQDMRDGKNLRGMLLY